MKYLFRSLIIVLAVFTNAAAWAGSCNPAPKLSITYPAKNGATVSGTIVFEASFSGKNLDEFILSVDPNGETAVLYPNLSIENDFFHPTAGEVYKLEIDTTKFPNGSAISFLATALYHNQSYNCGVNNYSVAPIVTVQNP